MSKEIKIRAESSAVHNCIRLFGYVKAYGVKAMIGPVEITEVTDGQQWEPFLNLKFEEAQTLLESLWEAGIRSPQITSTLGEINATKHHLKDMQRLVFNEKGK
tara:strand:+ start:1074 stop:1382 length:309 start_codon:yes stop_codon:yes gene_type:complete